MRPGLLIVVQKTGRRGNGVSLKSLLKAGSWLAHTLRYLVISSEVPDDVQSGGAGPVTRILNPISLLLLFLNAREWPYNSFVEISKSSIFCHFRYLGSFAGHLKYPIWSLLIGNQNDKESKNNNKPKLYGANIKYVY